MAFDRPLEADRVDNLGLLSSFVRAPFVAPIMWAIGGLLPEEKENTASLTSKQQLQEGLSRGSSNETPESNNDTKPQDTIDILIETSNRTDNSSSSSSLRRNTAKFEGLSTFKHHPNQSGDDQDEDIQSTSLWQTKKNRKTSWSDESGQDLVQYCNESSLNQGQAEGVAVATQVASKYTNQKKPMKSAMRKGSRRHNPSRCIPSMPPSVKGSCTASASASASNKGGYISPQWGWYITTTPPTPEYYAAGSQRHPVLSHQMNTNNAHLANQVTPTHHGNLYTNNVGKNDWVPSTSTTIEEASPKPLFTKGPLKYSSGWPTVPL